VSTPYPQHHPHDPQSARRPAAATAAIPAAVHAHAPHQPQPQRTQAPAVALLGLGLLALAGAWLAAAPFLLGGHGPGDQPRGAAWTAATRVDVSTGAAVTAVAVAALLGYLASSITHLARYRQVE
jgi:hypothetical protein